MNKDIMMARGVCKELLALFFPITTLLFLGNAVGSLERIFLARYSHAALNGAVQSLCALQFFQLSCIVFANMTQVFVAEHIGSHEFFKVGNRVWQMIWISLCSMLLIVPLGMATAPIFFKGTEHQELAYRYFKVLIAGNFLFPLGTTLSAFFLAQGKRWWVVWSSIAAYAVNLLLDTIFIFGIPSLVSPMGALGAAWSSLLSKFVFCLILFLCFLSKTHQATYKTHAWRVSLLSLWDCLRLCTPRAIGKAFAILVWTATTYLMVKKGGPYLSVLSIGSTLTLFCYFVSESVVQSLSVTISRFLGSKEYANLWKAWQFGIVFALIVSAVLAIPFLLFPDVVLSFFFSELPSGVEQSFFRNTIYWVWFWVFFNSLNAPQLAFLLAARKTVYYMLIMSLTWITSLLPIYYCLYHLEWSPHTFWFILSLDQLIVLLVNAFRVYFLSKSYRGNFQQVNVSINK